MLFPTIEFTVFGLLTLSIWLFASKTRLPLLILFNLAFYSFYNPVMTLYLIGWSFIVWCAGKYLKWCYLIIGFAVLQLAFWKAVDAKFIDFHTWGVPLGVSFFTFQGLTYLFARMGLPRTRPEEHIDTVWSFWTVLAFTGFFPTVLSGPILRAKYWKNQFDNPVEMTQKIFTQAMLMIAVGAFYKLCISSILHDYVSMAYANPKEDSPLNLLIGLYAYTFEIYHDFAGYSLMAIGIALLYGFRLPDNFRQPYLSANIRDFWQKWHISFSTWLRDYFYFSLGGSKVSESRHLVNTMIVMLVCGAWHGLNGHYLVWGAMHGVAVCLYHLSKNKVNLPTWLGWIITFHYVALAWIFFRTPDLQTGVDYIHTLFNLQAWHEVDLNAKTASIFVFFAICLGLQAIEPWLLNPEREYRFMNALTSIPVWAAVFVLILILSPSGMPPFIYFSY